MTYTDDVFRDEWDRYPEPEIGACVTQRTPKDAVARIGDPNIKT